MGAIFCWLHLTKLTLLNYNLNVFTIHIELIKKKKTETTHLKTISVSCRNRKNTFSTMSHSLLSRIYATDAFLDLVNVSKNDLISFPFHLSCQETHGKIKCLMWELVYLGCLRTCTRLFPFQEPFYLQVYTQFCCFILCLHCMFPQIL